MKYLLLSICLSGLFFAAGTSYASNLNPNHESCSVLCNDLGGQGAQYPGCTCKAPRSS